MIGPSAPYGPPVPMAMAEDRGLRTATLASMRLRPIRMASRASGIPWPRILLEPYRAMSPTTNPPATGIRARHGPNGLAAGDASEAAKRRKYARLVNRQIRRTSDKATNALIRPTAAAIH